MKDIFIKLIAVIAILFVVSLFMSYPAMLLWNYALVPAVTVLAPVGWWQMFGIMCLFSILVPKVSSTTNKEQK